MEFTFDNRVSDVLKHQVIKKCFRLCRLFVTKASEKFQVHSPKFAESQD